MVDERRVRGAVERWRVGGRVICQSSLVGVTPGVSDRSSVFCWRPVWGAVCEMQDHGGRGPVLVGGVLVHRLVARGCSRGVGDHCLTVVGIEWSGSNLESKKRLGDLSSHLVDGQLESNGAWIRAGAVWTHEMPRREVKRRPYAAYGEGSRGGGGFERVVVS